MKADDCIFCKIADGEIKAQIVDQTEKWVAFRDLNPQAPTHILLIPKEHYTDITVMADSALIGELVQGAVRIAQKENLTEEGFRIVNNIGKNGGQSVFHTHLHILGGRKLGWPPG